MDDYLHFSLEAIFYTKAPINRFIPITKFSPFHFLLKNLLNYSFVPSIFSLDNPVIFCFQSVTNNVYNYCSGHSPTSKTELEKILFLVTRQKFSRAFKMWSKIGYGSLRLFFRVQSNIGERGEYVSKRLFWNSAILWKNAIKDVLKYLGGNIIPKQYKH